MAALGKLPVGFNKVPRSTVKLGDTTARLGQRYAERVYRHPRQSRKRLLLKLLPNACLYPEVSRDSRIKTRLIIYVSFLGIADGF